MIDPEDTGYLPKDVSRRLVRTRKALGLNQEDFGEGAGLSQPRYNQYEAGGRLLTMAAALKLCERYALTLDWLYRGDPSGLPKRLYDALRKTS